MESAYDFMNKHFGTSYTKLSTIEEDFARSSISRSEPECMSSTDGKSVSIGGQKVVEKYRNSPYATEIDFSEMMLKRDEDQQTDVALDLKRFLSDHFSPSEMLQNTYKKNFSKLQC